MIDHLHFSTPPEPLQSLFAGESYDWKLILPNRIIGGKKRKRK